MTRHMVLVGFVLAMGPLSAAHAGTPRDGLYVYKPLEPLGADRRRVEAIDRRLSAWAERLVGRDRIIGYEQVKARLKRSKRLLAYLLCGVEMSCLVSFAKAFKARYVIGGDAAPVGHSFALSLVLADARTGSVVRRVSGVVPGSGSRTDTTLEELAVRLLAPARYTGWLRVQADVAGALFYLDGKLVGKTPLQQPVRVPCGAHAVRLTHPAYHDFVRFVRVPYKAEVVVRANMKAYPIFTAKLGSKRKTVTVVKGRRPVGLYRPLPWYKKWYTVTAVVAGSALLTGVITALVVYFTSPRTSVDADGTTPLGRPYQPEPVTKR